MIGPAARRVTKLYFRSFLRTPTTRTSETRPACAARQRRVCSISACTPPTRMKPARRRRAKRPMGLMRVNLSPGPRLAGLSPAVSPTMTRQLHTRRRPLAPKRKRTSVLARMCPGLATCFCGERSQHPPLGWRFRRGSLRRSQSARLMSLWIRCVNVGVIPMS